MSTYHYECPKCGTITITESEDPQTCFYCKCDTLETDLRLAWERIKELTAQRDEAEMACIEYRLTGGTKAVLEIASKCAARAHLPGEATDSK